MNRQRNALTTAAGAGLYAACAMSYVNHAAHQTDWGARIMFAAFGIYAGLGALRMAGQRRDPDTVGGPWRSAFSVAAMLLPLACGPQGDVIWHGGWWIAGAGALLGAVSVVFLGDCFGIAPAVRGVVRSGPYRFVRHPMATAFLAIAAGYLAVCWSPRNAVA